MRAASLTSHYVEIIVSLFTVTLTSIISSSDLLQCWILIKLPPDDFRHCVLVLICFTLAAQRHDCFLLAEPFEGAAAHPVDRRELRKEGKGYEQLGLCVSLAVVGCRLLDLYNLHIIRPLVLSMCLCVTA